MKKYLSVLLSCIATAYTIWYMHFGVPYLNSGALSKIGLQHHNYFIIWGVLTFVALCYNIALAYKFTNHKFLYIPFMVVAGIGMVLTLAFDFVYDKVPDYYLHCVGSLAFSVVTGVTIFILFALLYKHSKMYKVFTYITAAILLTDLVFLIIYKEDALIETLPVFAGYVLLGITNLRGDSVGLKQTVKQS